LGIIVLSFVVSMVLGCIVWLVMGDRFPLKVEAKFPPLNNIVIYTLICLIPVYLAVFFTFN
jgi:hypothetical protein